jgi:hypothetical protein
MEIILVYYLCDNLMYCPEIYMEGLRNSTQYLHQNATCPGRGTHISTLNTKHKSEAIPVGSACSMEEK